MLAESKLAHLFDDRIEVAEAGSLPPVMPLVVVVVVLLLLLLLLPISPKPLVVDDSGQANVALVVAVAGTVLLPSRVFQKESGGEVDVQTLSVSNRLEVAAKFRQGAGLLHPAWLWTQLPLV